jgi:hypothetical protein
MQKHMNCSKLTSKNRLQFSALSGFSDAIVSELKLRTRSFTYPVYIELTAHIALYILYGILFFPD